jgi:hypothetical protein
MLDAGGGVAKRLASAKKKKLRRHLGSKLGKNQRAAAAINARKNTNDRGK